MGETTGISWCDATLNFWVGCTKVSTGPKGACENCYAETWAKRWPAYRDTWGVGAPRVQFKHLLAKAMKLERLAIAKQALGDGAFFCFSNSLSDIFDNEVPIEWLAEAFAVMRATPHVTYLLLTKRAPNMVKRATSAGGLPPNAALGITVVTQEEADRDIPHLLRAKAVLKPTFAFLSMEPLRGPVDITRIVIRGDGKSPTEMSQRLGDYVLPLRGAFTDSPRIDWVISGGESGGDARPVEVKWMRDLRDQCAAAGTPFHFKQWGSWHADALAYTDMLGNNPPPNMKIGVNRAGRMLDGVVHDVRPEVAPCA